MPVVLHNASVGEVGSGIEPRKHGCFDSMKKDEKILPHARTKQYPHDENLQGTKQANRESKTPPRQQTKRTSQWADQTRRRKRYSKHHQNEEHLDVGDNTCDERQH